MTKVVDVVGTGFAVLDRVYATGAGGTWQALGGSCGNVLVSLAMLRRRVVPVLSFGDDEVGCLLVDEFEAAGAETRFISRRRERASPILAHLVDPLLGVHSFAWRCPTTSAALPRYQPIESEDLEKALPTIERCAVFYVDRLTEGVVEAMEMASRCGAIVFFEPSDAKRPDLLDRAVAASTIVKFSVDRIASGWRTSGGSVAVITHGDAGIEVVVDGGRRWLRPFTATDVRDTCGSGDMVSVGLIDWLLRLCAGR